MTAACPDLLRAGTVLLTSATRAATMQASGDQPTLDGRVRSMLAEAASIPPLPLPPPHGSCVRIIDTWYQAAAQAEPISAARPNRMCSVG